MADSCLLFGLTEPEKRCDGRTVCHALYYNEDTHAIVFINNAKVQSKFTESSFIRLVNYGYKPANGEAAVHNCKSFIL